MQTANALDQRMAHLRLANDVRITNARFKDGIRRLARTEAVAVACGLLRDPSPPSSALPVRELLMAIPRMGRTKVTAAIVQSGVANGDRRIRDLSDRQRNALATHLSRPAHLSRPTPLAMDILAFLDREGPSMAWVVHEGLGRPGLATAPTSSSLTYLRGRGLVADDGRSRREWSITDAGRRELSGVSS